MSDERNVVVRPAEGGGWELDEELSEPAVVPDEPMPKPWGSGKFVQIAVEDEIIYALDEDGRVWTHEWDHGFWQVVTEDREGT